MVSDEVQCLTLGGGSFVSLDCVTIYQSIRHDIAQDMNLQNKLRSSNMSKIPIQLGISAAVPPLPHLPSGRAQKPYPYNVSF